MADQSFVTDEIRARIGVPSASRQVSLSAEAVRRVREVLASGPVVAGDAIPPAALLALESGAPAADPGSLPSSSLVTGDEWEWRRSLQVGEPLTATSRLVDAYERFGGRLGHALFLRHGTAFASADGEPVAFTRRSVAHYDGAQAGQTDPPPEEMPPPTPSPPIEGVGPRRAREGDSLTAVSVTPTLGQVVRYCGAAWTFVPFFYDAAAARAAGLPGTIIPAPLKLALLSEMVRAWAGPDVFLEAIRAAHRRPNIPDQPITLRGTVARIEEIGESRRLECEVWIEDPFGKRSSVGLAALRIPTI